MRFSNIVILGLAALSSASGAAFATPATTTGHVTATVVDALLVEEDQEMDFATFYPAANQLGTITTIDSKFTNVTHVAGTVHSGEFTVYGEKLQHYSITVDPSVTLISGGDSMVADLTSTPSGQFDANSQDEFSVYGKLYVGANQNVGIYKGTYNVAVEYN